MLKIAGWETNMDSSIEPTSSSMGNATETSGGAEDRSCPEWLAIFAGINNYFRDEGNLKIRVLF